MDYLLKRWPAFARIIDEGRVCLASDAAERARLDALRPWNWRGMGEHSEAAA